MMAAKSSFLPPSNPGHPRVSGHFGAVHSLLRLISNSKARITDGSIIAGLGAMDTASQPANARLEKLDADKDRDGNERQSQRT